MINREEVLSKAYNECIREMFAKAQPAADYDNLIEEYRTGKINEDKDGPVYNRHYLSQEEYVYILNKYLDAYNIKSEWQDHADVIIDYLEKGGYTDKYITNVDKETGIETHSREAENVPPLKDHILEIMNEFDSSEVTKEVGEKIYDKTMELISMCKNFYKFNMDETKFRNTLALFSATPTSNKETVKKWWKDHYDVDIEIEERNPLLLWEMDYYGDEFEEIMEDEYGPDWKEIWDKKWKDEEAKKNAEREKRMKELLEEQNKQLKKE